ncbi:MAG: ECF transporter S component [Deltaproteobacteria bacterium]|nr:ECF transporter S component [Deltaproteobacteria bacterium]
MTTRQFSLLAVFMALVAVATMIVRIPIPQTTGYMNLGDTMVLLSGVFFGPLGAFMAGGIGSALADIMGGYPQWALWTLIIKGIEGMLIGLLIALLRVRSGKISISMVACFVLATAWMVLGYFVAEAIMYDQKAALAEVPANIMQALGSVILASLLFPLFYRVINGIKK